MRTAIGAPFPEDEDRLGRLLVGGRVVTEEQLTRAHRLAAETGRELHEILVEELGVKPFQLLQARAYLARMQAVDLTQNPPDPAALGLVSRKLAREHAVVPLARRTQDDIEVLYVAISDPGNLAALDAVRAATGMKVQPVLVSEEQLADALWSCYAPPPAEREPQLLRVARDMAKQLGKSVDEVLIGHFGVKPFQVLQARASLAKMQAVDLEQNPPEPTAPPLIPGELARRRRVLPLARRVKGEVELLYAAIDEPENFAALDAVREITGLEVQPVLAMPEQLTAAIERRYPAEEA
jgi:hypothetical protein